MILGISGSLRRSSINSAVLRAAASVAAQDGISVAIDDSVRNLPQFDPDLEGDPPVVVQRFRAACEDAAGVLFAVPEYAFGIPGAFKNALDWDCRERLPLPQADRVAQYRTARPRTACPRGAGSGADGARRNVAHYSIPVAPGDRDGDGEVSDAMIVDEVRAVVAELATHARATAQPALRSY